MRCVRAVLPAAAVLLAVAWSAASASARVALLAGGDGASDVTVLDVGSGKVLRKVALPGASTAVAVSRDGRVGYAAGGGQVLALDLRAPSVIAPAGAPAPGGGLAATTTLPPEPLTLAAATVGPRALGSGDVVALATSPGGGTLYAAAGSKVYALDARTLAPIGSAELHGVALDLAVAPGGTQGAATLRGGRVAILDLHGPRLVRRVKVKGASGVAFAGGRAWVSTTRGRLRTIARGAAKATKGIKVPKDLSGRIAASPDGLHLIVGPGPRGTKAAIVDLAPQAVHLFRTAPGPAAPAYAPDGARAYLAGGAAVALVSAFSHARTGSLPLAASAIAIQPGLALALGTDGADTLLGTRSQDLLEGLGGDDHLAGGRENDILHGGDGNDVLDGGPYDDRLDGGAGDDQLNGSSGNDAIDGGDGTDNATGGTGNDRIHGGPGDDHLDGGDGDDRIYGEDGNDYIDGGAFGNDARLIGGAGDDTIHGGRGSDHIIEGNQGNDKLYGESGTEHILGGDGDDLIDGGSARDLLEGNNGSDTIAGSDGDDLLEGGAGADLLDGGDGADEIYGDGGADTITGGPGADVIEAGDGDDTIRAADDSADSVDCGEGNDTVYVENTAPTRDRLVGCESVVPIPPEQATTTTTTSLIRGTTGNDVLHGTPGPDSIFGKQGKDKLFGGGGDDYVDGEWGDDELHGGPGDDTIAGRSGDDRIFGDAGDDQITGDRGADHISGGAGNDTLFGNLGPDTISGGSGDDRINVVRGEIDTVRCGSGHDTVLADPTDHIAADCEDIRR